MDHTTVFVFLSLSGTWQDKGINFVPIEDVYLSLCSDIIVAAIAEAGRLVEDVHVQFGII